MRKRKLISDLSEAEKKSRLERFVQTPEDTIPTPETLAQLRADGIEWPPKKETLQ